MTLQNLWLFNFKDDPGTLSHWSVSRQEWMLFIFSFTTVSERSSFNGIVFLGLSFDCGKSVLQHFKSSWLLPAKNDYRLLNTQDCSTNAYLKRFSRKLETNLRWGLFYMGIFWVVGLQTAAYLKWSTLELYKKPKTRTTKTKKEHVRLDGGRCGYQNQWWYLCIRCYQNL